MRASYRVAAVSVITVLVFACTGCFKATTDIAVRPDLGVDFAVTMGVPRQFAEQMEGAPGDEMGMDKVETYTEGDWYYMRGMKSVEGKKEVEMPSEANATFTRTMQEHRLSNRYLLKMDLPSPAQGMDMAGEQMPQQAPSAEGEQAEQQEAIKAMMSGMMSGFEYSINVTMPGMIASTSGEKIAPDTVKFSLGWEELQKQEAQQLVVGSVLPSYTRIGRLADQLVLAGADPLVGLHLVQYVNDGLLPDPPIETDAEKKLQAADYLTLVRIIETLDTSLTPEMTTKIINSAGLNADDCTSGQIDRAYGAIRDMDLQAVAVSDIAKKLQ